jgi:hypothetical protein
LVIIGPGIGLPGPIAFLGAEGRLRPPKRQQKRRERRSCELISKKPMPKSRVYVPSLRHRQRHSMNADGGILNIPWAWSQIRRGRTFERHRVQRRLEECTFARKCAGGRRLGPGVMLSFRSLANPGERTTEGVEHLKQAPDRFQDGPPSFETIDRRCNVGV